MRSPYARRGGGRFLSNLPRILEEAMSESHLHNMTMPQAAANPRANVGVPYIERPKPFLARHPWVGYLVFLVFAAIFAWMTWQVATNGPFTAGDEAQIQALHVWAWQQKQPVILTMRFFSAFGRDGVALIMLVLAIRWIRRRARRELYMLIFGVGAGEMWFQLLGGLVSRHRPQFPVPFETLGIGGYPSGHATTNVILGMLILYLVLPRPQSWLRRALITAAVVAVIALVCYSRLFLGLHYVSDIYGGVVLGIAWGALVLTLTDVYFWSKDREVNKEK